MRDTYRFGLNDHTQPQHPDYQRYRQTQAWFLNQLKVYPYFCWTVLRDVPHHIPSHVVHDNHVAIARVAPDFYMYAYATRLKFLRAFRDANGRLNAGWPDLATMQTYGILWPHNDLPNNFPIVRKLAQEIGQITNGCNPTPPPEPKIDYAAITRSIVGR